VTRLSADLTLRVATAEGQTASGHLSGSNGRLRLDIDNPGLFAGSGDSGTVRGAAEELAAQGISIRVVHDGVHLVTIGAVSAPWWQRRATGSRRIKVGSWRGAWTSLRSRATQQGAVLPTAEALPPPTMLPLAPTFARHPRRRVTTTHTPAGSGSPRLVLKKQQVWDGERQPIFWLSRTVTTIGSHASCDIVLPGIEPLHTVVLHDEDDEYLLESCGPETRVHGVVVEVASTLRTGARIDVGPHSLAFYREEYADHGRPYGGREGGEIGHQRDQPPRPTRARPAAASEPA
jgi:hypothetical protein